MAAAAGPSQFAQLLKRSKFASFDPSISQIYTTYGGYAHRGDFGLKRPFPLSARNKHPYVVVKAVDDSLGQTIWSTAQNQGRWVRRFDESGAGAEAQPRAPWSRGRVMAEWHLDSSFDQPWAREKLKEKSPATLPNWAKMNQAEFDEYLDKLRSKRGEFRQYLQDRKQAEYNTEMEAGWDYYGHPSADMKPPSPPKPINLLEESRQANNKDFRAFLEQDANKQAYSSKEGSEEPSNKIVPSPHPNAGLAYNYENKLQRAFLYPSLPGRVIHTRGATDPRRVHNATPASPLSIAVAGTLAEFKGTDRENGLRLNAVSQGHQDVTAGEVQAKIEGVAVLTGPHVVGKHSGLGGGRVVVKASEDRTDAGAVYAAAYNPNTPGTMEYVGWTPVPSYRAASTTTPTSFKSPRKGKGKDTSHTAVEETSAQLRKLASMLKKGPEMP